MKINAMEKTKDPPLSKMLSKIYCFVNSNKTLFFFYDKVVTFLGFLSVLFSLAFITLIIAFDSFLGFFLPSVNGLLDFLLLIISIAMAISVHELSHIVILANRSVRARSAGLSLKGIVGGYVEADVDEETYGRLIQPFFSCGLGSNLLLFLILGLISIVFPILWIPAAVNLWFAVLNSIPAPLMDGGKIFEIYLQAIRNKIINELLPLLIMLLWFVIFIFKFIIM